MPFMQGSHALNQHGPDARWRHGGEARSAGQTQPCAIAVNVVGQDLAIYEGDHSSSFCGLISRNARK